jgi:DNA-binding CsgD family transcriptional regulator
MFDAQRRHPSDRRVTLVVGQSQVLGVRATAAVTYRATVSIVGLCDSPADSRSLRLALLDELRRLVGFDAHAWLLTDPVTEVGTAPIADVPCLPELPRLIKLKYSTSVNRWTHLAGPVALLHTATDGRLDRSLVWRELLEAHGVSDVASVVFRDQYGCWSFLDLWRVGSTFTDGDADVIRRHAHVITAAIRRCVARTFAAPGSPMAAARTGPIVLVLSGELQVRAQTAETEQYLRTLVPPDGDRQPVPASAYNVAAQLIAVEGGVDDHRPAARVHLDDGAWLTLRAARIHEDIAVSIEVATPAERCELFARSAGLTARETELVDLLVGGADTRALAQRMFVSEHTVQDHLKSIFAKTGAHNRRELVARATGR